MVTDEGATALLRFSFYSMFTVQFFRLVTYSECICVTAGQNCIGGPGSHRFFGGCDAKTFLRRDAYCNHNTVVRMFLLAMKVHFIQNFCGVFSFLSCRTSSLVFAPF